MDGILFNEPMHKEPIIGNKDIYTEVLDDPSRRVRTQGAVVVMCTMIGVQPPDKIKLDPCAVKETWVGE